jgi:hypothetical protein
MDYLLEIDLYWLLSIIISIIVSDIYDSTNSDAQVFNSIAPQPTH